MSRRLDIETAAAAWVLRKSDGLTPEEQARMDVWLADAPEHRVAFWRLERGWNQAGRLSALRSPDPLDTTVVRTPRWASSVGRRQVFAIAAGLVMAVGLAVLTWPRSDVFQTEIGERQQLTLEDGSRLDLNTRTRLRASMSDNVRQAWLDEGEAYFSIAHDENRPFVLHMGQRTVRVLGTRFIARRHGDHVSVTVAEGRVSVTDAGHNSDAPLILTVGDAVSIEGASLLRRQETPQSIDAELAWRGGQLVFDQVLLGEVAAEFNRYNHTQIEIDDASTRAIRIGGTFEANNVDAFLRLLSAAYGLHVERDGETVIISD